MQHDNSQNANAHASEPRNKGKLIGAKLALHSRQEMAISGRQRQSLITTVVTLTSDMRRFHGWNRV
jgi:hypothetical protein